MIPTWHAASDSSIVSICSSACSAPDSPSFASASILPLRVRTRRELRRDEDPVHEHEQEQQEEEYSRHCPDPLKPAGRGREAEQPADCCQYFEGGRPWRTAQR